jgi:hypothetical protein
VAVQATRFGQVRRGAAPSTLTCDIEAQALREPRHPSRSERLRSFLEGEQPPKPDVDDDLAAHASLAPWIATPLPLDRSVPDPPGTNQGVARSEVGIPSEGTAMRRRADGLARRA